MPSLIFRSILHDNWRLADRQRSVRLRPQRTCERITNAVLMKSRRDLKRRSPDGEVNRRGFIDQGVTSVALVDFVAV